jgi:hypothetical protein
MVEIRDALADGFSIEAWSRVSNHRGAGILDRSAGSRVNATPAPAIVNVAAREQYPDEVARSLAHRGNCARTDNPSFLTGCLAGITQALLTDTWVISPMYSRPPRCHLGCAVSAARGSPLIPETLLGTAAPPRPASPRKRAGDTDGRWM